VGDHWGVSGLADYPDKTVPMYVCEEHMVESAKSVGFDHAERVAWGRSVALSDQVRLDVIEEHIGRGKATNNYAIVSDDARVFFGGEVLDLDALRRHMATAEAYDVAIGPVNGVQLMGRRLTATAAEMLDACRILGADTLVPIHDEHRPIPLLLKVTSSVRDFDHLAPADVNVVELGFGERFAPGL
jgi:L-ascorbate metabolism protein UlaG (beta-lactamase superfamily)